MSQLYTPNIETFSQRAHRSRLIPVSRKILADLDTPLTLFAKVATGDDHAFLFESMEGGEKWGRYSFIGYDPLTTLSTKDNNIEITEMNGKGEKKKQFQANPFDALKNLIKELNAYEDDTLPRFCGGAVGFLGYDMVRFIEELPDTQEKLDMVDASFIVPRIVLIHDSFEQTVTVVCWVDLSAPDNVETLYKSALEQIDRVVGLVKGPVPEELTKSSKGIDRKHEFTSNMEKSRFYEMVDKAREYIMAGDIIQVVLSQRFHAKTELSPLTLYRALRHINPSPYLFFLQLGDLIQIGSSPEILVRKEGDVIELRPIAGTRKRGKSVEEDLAFEKELLADPKEKAEHLMLVDLGRNDVGRVARHGSVEVKDLLVIERYSHVMHIVSGVHGLIQEGKDQFDVMASCFPAGTVSGAPKIRAMEIIDELELERRGPYAGAVGYFGFSGNMDFCITIRTFFMRNDDLWVQAGAGIVADSVAANEYEETINKSMGLRRAVELAEKGF